MAHAAAAPSQSFLWKALSMECLSTPRVVKLGESDWQATLTKPDGSLVTGFGHTAYEAQKDVQFKATHNPVKNPIEELLQGVTQSVYELVQNEGQVWTQDARWLLMLTGYQVRTAAQKLQKAGLITVEYPPNYRGRSHRGVLLKALVSSKWEG